MMPKPQRINPNTIRVRDLALVRLINGATKGGAHVDRRREQARRACRKRICSDDE
jgi:hypothetical protein